MFRLLAAIASLPRVGRSAKASGGAGAATTWLWLFALPIAAVIVASTAPGLSIRTMTASPPKLIARTR